MRSSSAKCCVRVDVNTEAITAANSRVKTCVKIIWIEEPFEYITIITIVVRIVSACIYIYNIIQ